ncbi:MAG TPA: 50S rRNA methyltransferase [Desulfobulbaceae bacterium]|nr:50S rRNA methyltransferase [Desulfobulbaceae bacterium]
MRKVRDYYAVKAKKEHYPARSVYKLEEIQQKYRLLRSGDAVLDIGCFPGSWSMFAGETVGEKGLVVGVDLQQGRQAPRLGSAPIHWLRFDIREPDFLAEVRKIRPAFKVLLCDIAPKTTGNRWTDAQQSLRLVRVSLKLAETLLSPGGNYLTKVFQGEDVPALLQELRRAFALVKVLKPRSSRAESREVFILAMSYRGGEIIAPEDGTPPVETGD